MKTTAALTPKKILTIILLTSVCLLLFFKIQIDDTRHYCERFHTLRDFFGDEVYYLRMVQSLATDGNLELSNLWELSDVWRTSQYKNKPDSNTLPADDLITYGLNLTGKNGGTYALHLPGISLLLLPAYLLDAKFHPNDPAYDPARITLLPQKMYFTRLLLALIAVTALLLLYRLLTGLFDSLAVIFLLLLLLVLNSPFSGYIFQVVPELWAMFFGLLAMNAIFFPFQRKWLNPILIIISIGTLPWLHQRHAALALGLLLAYLYYRYKDKYFYKKTAIIILSLGAAGCLYLYYFYSITGIPSPTSTSSLHGRAYSSLANLPLGFFGNILHPVAGFIWHYPWTLLFLFGLFWGFKKSPRLTIALLLIFLPYFMMASTSVTWSGATWPRNRYMVALYPILLIFCGLSIHDLIKEFSYTKLLFYLSFISAAILNKKLWFINFPFSDNFQNPSITKTDLSLMIKSTLLFFLIFMMLFLGDKFLFKKKRDLALL